MPARPPKTVQRSPHLPAPRLTLWAPILLALFGAILWLALVALARIPAEF